MKHIEFNVPAGAALQLWAGNNYRLVYPEVQAVQIRDWLAKLANVATEIAVQSIDEIAEEEKLNKIQRIEAAAPEQTKAQKLAAQKARLQSEEKFIPMNPKVDIPLSMQPVEQAQNIAEPRGGIPVVKDNGQDFTALKPVE